MPELKDGLRVDSLSLCPLRASCVNPAFKHPPLPTIYNRPVKDIIENLRLLLC